MSIYLAHNHKMLKADSVRPGRYFGWINNDFDAYGLYKTYFDLNVNPTGNTYNVFDNPVYNRISNHYETPGVRILRPVSQLSETPEGNEVGRWFYGDYQGVTYGARILTANSGPLSGLKYLQYDTSQVTTGQNVDKFFWVNPGVNGILAFRTRYEPDPSQYDTQFSTDYPEVTFNTWIKPQAVPGATNPYFFTDEKFEPGVLGGGRPFLIGFFDGLPKLYNDDTLSRYLNLEAMGNGVLSQDGRSPGEPYAVYVDVPITLNEWHQLTVVRTWTDAWMYLDREAYCHCTIDDGDPDQIIATFDCGGICPGATPGWGIAAYSVYSKDLGYNDHTRVPLIR